MGKTIVDWMFEYPFLATILGIFFSFGIANFRIVSVKSVSCVANEDGRPSDGE